LFVRFLVHGNAQGLDARGRWNWIYRVVTSHSLRQLADDVRPGALALGPDAGPDASLPEMRVLRRMDETTQSIAVLAGLDGLTNAEIAEVLGLGDERIQRGIVAAGALAAGRAREPRPDEQPAHPSMLSLDRDRALNAEHLLTCERCRKIVDDGDRLTARFAGAIAPTAIPRVAAAVRAERAREASGLRWKRLAWLGGGLALVCGLALVVARPRSPDRGDIPYAGLKGASRAQAAGIQISLGHGAEVRPLDPTTTVAPGDRLFFRVRAERPRYLELRVRDPDGDRRLFPVGGGDAVLVRPGQALGAAYLVSTAGSAGEAKERTAHGGKIWIVGLFSDQPFPLDRPPGPDVEVLPVRIDVVQP
jgi:hypothetical protein